MFKGIKEDWNKLTKETKIHIKFITLVSFMGFITGMILSMVIYQ